MKVSIPLHLFKFFWLKYVSVNIDYDIFQWAEHITIYYR